MCFDWEGSSPSPDDRGLLAALGKMPVDAVPGDVEDAVLEPFDRDVAGPRTKRFSTFVKGFIQSMRLPCSAQKPLGSATERGVHLLVFCVIDPGALRPIRRYVVDLLGHRPLHLNCATLRADRRNRLDCWRDYASRGLRDDKAEAALDLGWLRPWAGRRTIRAITFPFGRKREINDIE